MPPELTPTRLQLLSVILRLGSRATLTQVARDRGVSKPAISKQIAALQTLGYLEANPDRYGPLTLTDLARRTLDVGIPIYGQIAAGRPTLADQAPDDRTPDLETLLGMRDGDFLLRVTGDSMTGIGVLDGDYVIIRPTEQVNDGEVAVVLIPGDNAATLKRLYHFGQDIILRSENPAMVQMSFPADQVRVQGRMVGRVGVGVPRVSARRE
ncbi:repressor LexA [Deinococcus metalli]|uniref:LexA repressor n=1 Tax=Deinococcus metalli TaxID=1141878 RepID=A0A7W8KH36_9DEIO|nr:S24 family peptidase [Deinococcus metalli]MBB5378084.1 repressor LexA [Deinococcus metalli]GHF54300.1 lexA repressor [Deinococcus metalli]